MFGLFNRHRAFVDSGLLDIAIDRHSHILYGVDDGVRSLDESLAILSWLESLGLRTLWLTPHVMEDVPNTTSGLQERFCELQVAYKGGISLHLAAEYMIDNLFESRLEARDLLHMEDNRVLMETSTWSSPYGLYEILDNVMRAGYRPLLAHPERYRYMEYSDYRKLVSMGVQLQLNLPSLAGVYGSRVMEVARKLLADGMYSEIGSDCHRLSSIRRVYESKVFLASDIGRIRNCIVY
ncbi:MAG: capsular biosynthesis protein [Bacteroidales bacterium]|nr:capsular biosynthesis protein [Bacteroidales bacterium]